MKTRDEAWLQFAADRGWRVLPCGDIAAIPQRSETGPLTWPGTIRFPAPDAALPEMLEFVGRVALATFPHEDKVFHYGWVHGVLENCTEDARMKYDPCFAALLAALAALEAR